MILYSKQLTGAALLLRLHGSPVWRALPYGLAAAGASVAFGLAGDAQQWLESNVVHPYVFQVSVSVLTSSTTWRLPRYIMTEPQPYSPHMNTKSAPDSASHCVLQQSVFL